MARYANLVSPPAPKSDGSTAAIGALVDDIRELIKAIAPQAIFEYDEASMMNIKADDVRRTQTLVYIEEISTSRIEPAKYYYTRTTPVYIYFCRFEPFQNDAYLGDTRHSQQASGRTVPRQSIRDEIETGIVLPFIASVRGWFARLGIRPTYTLDYPPPRFDAHEVSVRLTVNISQFICLDQWEKTLKK